MQTVGESRLAVRFVRTWALSAFIALAFAVCVNALVDPHGLVRWVDAPGFNAIKPRAIQEIEAFKYRAIDSVRPKALILGNSRAEMGWNPEIVNRARLGPTVNAAIPGRGLDAMAPLADYAWHVSRPATLIVGAEFFDCLVSGAAPAAAVASAVSPWSRPAEGPGGRIARMRLFIPDLFSFDTLTDSVRTVLAQRNAVAPHLRADGFQSAREYPDYLRVDGPRKMFLQRDHDYIARRIDGPKSVRFDGGVPAPCFQELAAILEQARVREQRVFVATYPFHVRLLETISALGLWPAYQDWKAEVVRTVDAARARGAQIELRDFSGFHRYAQDRLPPDGQRVPAPEWYWESGHFKSVLGAHMLEIMLGRRPAEGSFGATLTGANLDGHAAALEQEKLGFEADHPELVTEIRRLVAAHAPRVPVESGRRLRADDRPLAGSIVPSSAN